MEKILTFIANARSELHKVIFPTKIQVKQAFLAVLLVVTVISLFLSVVDFIMGAVVKSALGA